MIWRTGLLLEIMLSSSTRTLARPWLMRFPTPKAESRIGKADLSLLSVHSSACYAKNTANDILWFWNRIKLVIRRICITLLGGSFLYKSRRKWALGFQPGQVQPWCYQHTGKWMPLGRKGWIPGRLLLPRESRLYLPTWLSRWRCWYSSGHRHPLASWKDEYQIPEPSVSD